MTEATPAPLSRLWVSAFLWPLGATYAIQILVTELSILHYHVDWYGANALWAPWFEQDHPMSLAYWAVAMLSAGGLMALWLQARGAWASVWIAGILNRRILLLVIAGVVITWLTSFAVEAVTAWIMGVDELESYRPGYEWEMTFANAPSDFLLGVIAAPLFEETAFRGLLMGFLLARGCNPWTAVAIASAAFAYTHQQYFVWGMIDIFIVGLIFGGLRIVSGGLAAPMLCHALVNLTISGADLTNLMVYGPAS